MMDKKLRSTLYSIVLILSLCTPLNAQDSFFHNFHSAKSFFNPSLVGNSGSMSLNAKHKRQWGFSDPLFESTFISLEESLPCTFIDWGISALYDREGTAGLVTREFAFTLAGTIPFGNRKTIHNIKLGFAPRFSRKSIDYSRLIFSDQLDPKYGLNNSTGAPNSTSFVPPNDGRSSQFFRTSYGVSLISIFNAHKNNPITSTIGMSMYHSLSLSDGLGNIESIQQLDQGAQIPLRYSLYAELETIPIVMPSYYIAITPSIYYHHQSEIDYIEAGASMTYSRDVRIGLYLQWSPNNFDQLSSNSIIGQFDIALIKSKEHRIDLGISYANTISGLQNIRGNTIEVSFTYHLKKSVTCSLAGHDGNPASVSPECPGVKFAGMKRYQDLWYYTIDKRDDW